MKRRSFIASVVAMLGLGKVAPAANRFSVRTSLISSPKGARVEYTTIHPSKLSNEWCAFSVPTLDAYKYNSKTILIRCRAIEVDKMQMRT